MVDTSTWTRVADADFVSLTTYRRTGEGVATPVWVARDGDALVVTTPPGTGKVKRLRRDPRVELRPCSRRGRVADDAPRVTGRAEVLGDDDAVSAAHRALRAEYGLEFRLVMGVERLLRRGRVERVILRITPDAAGRGRADR